MFLIRKGNRSQEENAVMAEISRIISSTLNIDEVYVRFAEETHKLIPFDGIAINIINRKEGIVTVPYVSGIGVKGDAFPLEGSVTGEAAQTRSSLIIQMKDKKELEARFPTLLTSFQVGVRALIVVPLISKDQAIGAIHFRSAKPNVYLEQHLKLAERIANQIAGAIANAQLFSERKQTEEALQESEERYRSFFDNSIDAVLLTAPDGTILAANHEAYRMFGYTEEELRQVGRNVVVDPLDPRLPLALEERNRTGRFKGELSLRRKDGTKFLAEISSSVFKDKDGHFKTSMIIRDITERKQAEAALRDSEARYSAVVQQAKDGVLIIQDNILQFVNEALAEILGYTPGEIENTSFINYVAPESRPMVAERVKARLAGEDVPQVYEAKLLRKDGTIIDAELSASVIQHLGKPVDVGIIRDITERKRAEEELRQSEKKYRSVIENIQDVFYRSDLKGCLLMGSPSGAKMFGYDTIDEMIGMPLDSLWPDPENRKWLLAQIKETGGVKDFEAVLKRKDGTTFDASFTTHFYYDDNGNLLGTEGIIRDITERKRAEEALRESEERFKGLFEQSPFSTQILDANGWTLQVNKGWEQLWNSTPDMLANYNMLQDPQLEESGTLEYLKKAFSGEAVRIPPIEYSVEKQVGKGPALWVQARAFPVKDDSGNVREVILMHEDFTEQRRAEEALRESETRFRRMVESSPLAIGVANQDARLEYLNPKFVENFGYTLEDVPTLEDWFRLAYPNPTYRQRVAEEWQILLQRAPSESQAAQGMEVELTCKDGSVRDIEVFGTLMRSKTLAVFNDLTERKRAEEERGKLEIQMREVQKLESLGVLAGGIAHDFNNLLMAILGNADLALLSLSSASPARQNIEEIVKASQHAADLCRQMLAYSGRGRFVLGQYNLSEIIQEMAHMLQISVSKKATLNYQLTRDLPAVEADATQLRQVVMNLITNASDALGDTSGVIEVSSGLMECDRVYLSESYLADQLPEGRYVYLEVSDTGCGMDAETRSRIFDPFFTTKFTGRGLGLAAVLGIVRGHKGAIKVYSEPGKGTTIKVLFPAVEWKPAERAQTAEQSTLPARGGTILLVDDDQAVLNVGSIMLERLGFTVLTASDGQEGLEVFRKREAEIDCVLLDLTMPRMSGEEVFREMRLIRSDVRVILSSGYNEQEVTQRFAGKGLTGFVQKPYTLAKLREILKRSLG